MFPYRAWMSGQGKLRSKRGYLIEDGCSSSLNVFQKCSFDCLLAHSIDIRQKSVGILLLPHTVDQLQVHSKCRGQNHQWLLPFPQEKSRGAKEYMESHIP